MSKSIFQISISRSSPKEEFGEGRIGAEVSEDGREEDSRSIRQANKKQTY